jgi:hypothetical protein
VVLIGFLAVAFGALGCLSTFAPSRTAEFLRARLIPVRIGTTVETTSRNVRIVGIVFLGVAVISLAGLIVMLTIPGMQLPFV